MQDDGEDEPVRRVEAREYGGPEVLEWTEGPDPRPSAGQVLVEVDAVPLLYLDTQIRSGWGRRFGLTPPYVPGSGYVGRVVVAGPGVDPEWAGRTVAVDTGAAGGYTQRAAVETDRLIPVPDGVDPPVAAALLHDGRTALGLCEAVPVRPGDRVLVLGASGGLGLLLVQLARSAGARVVAAARGARKLALTAEAGAHATVDHTRTDWHSQALEAAGRGGGFDVIFDGVGGELGTAAFELTAAGGLFSAHGAPSGGFAAVDPARAERRGVTLTGIEAAQYTPADVRRLTAAAFDAAAAGMLRPVIGQSSPLSRAAEAHRAVEARQVVGKTVLLNAAP